MRGETSTTKSGRRKWWRKFLRGGKANLSGSIRPWTDPLHSAADTCLSFRSPNCVDCLSTVSSSLPELLYIYFRRASLSLFFISRRLLFERLLRYLVEIPESISFQLIPGHWQRAPLPAPVHVSRAPSLYIFIDIRTEWALLLLPNTHEKNKSINTKPAAGFWFTE